MSELLSESGSIVEEINPAADVPIGDPAPKKDRARGAQQWVVLAAFLLGVVLGAFGFAAYNIFAGARGGDGSIRAAARDGFMDGIATLQAGGAPSEASGEGSTTAPVSDVVTTTFEVREANRLGDKNAKVTLIEFADFQCPFCARWFQQVEPQILQQYVQSGQVSIVYKHLAFLGQESVWAAQASECAANQNKFWQYHDYLYQHQNGENLGAFTKDRLIAFAQALELDMAQFTPCLANDETADRVQTDTLEGRQTQANATPTFFVNGLRLVGAQPYSTFQAAIDQALRQ